jgi:hypothetical protein
MSYIGGNVNHQMIHGEIVSEKFKIFQQRWWFFIKSTWVTGLLEKLENEEFEIGSAEIQLYLKEISPILPNLYEVRMKLWWNFMKRTKRRKIM